MAQANDLAKCLGGNRIALMRGYGFVAAAGAVTEVLRLSVCLLRNARALMRKAARRRNQISVPTVAIAGAIIRQRIGKFDPSTYPDRYQEGLRRLIEAKLKGIAIKSREVITPPP